MTKFANRAKMSISTTGTGNVTLNAAVAGYRTFAASGIVDTDQIRYIIEDGAAFEIGIGLMSSSATVMARTVDESSNSNNALNLTSAAKVLIGITAGDLEANPAPRWTTEPASTLALANNGSTAVTLTGVAVDENFPVRYSWDGYIGSTIYDADSLPPQLASAPVINQSTGVTSLVGSSTGSNAGTYFHRSRATDGINTLSSTTAISLAFFPTSAHKITAPHPQSNSVFFGFSPFIGDTYYGSGASYMTNNSVAGAGGVYAFKLSDNSALTGFNPLALPNAATNDYGGYSVGYSAGKEIVVSAYTRGVGVAYIYTLPSTSPTTLSPSGWSGSGSTTFTVAQNIGSGSDTNTYERFGRQCAISPNGNYVAIMSDEAAQVQVFAGKAFGSHSKGDHIRTIQVTGNGKYGSYAPHAVSANNPKNIACNDTHVIVSQGTYHSDSDVSDVGRVTLYNMSTGAEVTTGAFPYFGATADLHAGGDGLAITNNYAAISLTVNNSGPTYNAGYALINLSDNSVVVRSVAGNSVSQSQYVKLSIFQDEYVITGQYATGSNAGVLRVWKITDGSEKTNSLFPLAGDAASDFFYISAAGASKIVGGGSSSSNGGSQANQGYIKLLT